LGPGLRRGDECNVIPAKDGIQVRLMVGDATCARPVPGDEKGAHVAIATPSPTVTPTAPVLVEIRKLTKFYQRGGQIIPVLVDLDLDVRLGDFVALMGPSGSGKSTLLNLIAGIDKPSGGTIKVGDVDIARLSEADLARWRATHVGFVFQFYNLMPVLTALENVELPLLLASMSRRERRERVDIVLSLVGLADRADHYPNELSGGQQQRVAIARALITDPTLIVADEPTGDLDRTTGEEILALLDRLNRELRKTILMVTHDPKAAEKARRIVHLEKGLLVDP
jgi:putative ABC transport system ATP-binding protein